MKKLLVLFVAISFFAGFSLVACGPSEQAPAPAKEEAKPRSCSCPGPGYRHGRTCTGNYRYCTCAREVSCYSWGGMSRYSGYPPKF